MKTIPKLTFVVLIFSAFLSIGSWLLFAAPNAPDNAPKILFVRGGSGTGGFLEGGSDDQLADITDTSTAGGNHGWATLATVLEAEGFVLEQITEGPANNNTPVDFANMDLAQYSVIVLGSNNADYGTAAIDAIEAYVRGGGGLLLISDANFGQDWDDAPDSDQLFLDRFGFVMNQDQGTYALARGDGDFVVPDHPILLGVDSFDGEGVSPITVGNSLAAGVNAQVVALAENQLRQNDADGQGSSRSVTAADGALVVATVDNGRLVGHFDRNTFFNLNGAGTSIERLDNKQYARNLFNWLAGRAIVSGVATKWHPITLSFAGPFANETDDAPNPFLDYRLQVTLMGPSGQVYDVPGFFAGDGAGSGSGNVWQIRFAPDQAGTWTYTTSFRSGTDVAVSLDAGAGTAVSFDGSTGTITVADLDTNAEGFLSQGRLEYVNEHYLKFRDGSFWIKGGTDSPENFLGYKGFDNTVNQPGGVGDAGLENGLHRYTNHIADWQTGDPNFVSVDTGTDGKGIIGALNYLSAQNVNSIYFLPMNLGGDGRETYPFVDADNTAYNKTHYDISKLEQWNIVFDHAQRKGIALHFVLAETEIGNETWFDSGSLGVERKLYYRELIARFGYLLAIKWNLSEENDFSVANLEAFASYIQALDWQKHPITVHTHPNNFQDYDDILGDGRFATTSIQYNPNLANDHVENWRTQSANAGRPWVIDMDENNPAGSGLNDGNADDLRKRVLYDVYFSGGNIEWYAGYHSLPLGGDIRMEDFSTREEMWNYMWYARDFMAQNLPFWDMAPADGLLTEEDGAFGGGQVFAKAGEVYAIYLPDASSSGIFDLSGASGSFEQYWYNPRTGSFVGSPININGGGNVTLGAPPADGDEDWVILITNGDPIETPTPGPTPTVGPTATPITPLPLQVASFTLINADTDEEIQPLNNGDTINYATLSTMNLNVRANVTGEDESVVFELDTDSIVRTENTVPYALAGDTAGDYAAWTPTLGTHQLVATPYGGENASGEVGIPLSITFFVIDDATAPTATPIPVNENVLYLPLVEK